MSSQRPQLSLVGAVAIGLASMLGAGVFAVFAGADALAGNLLLLATIIAGLVAALNALSVLQLARQIERPGGVYSYSRVYLNDTTSFIAGFSFVLGKIGSIAAIALTFATYAAPNSTPWVASIAVITLTLLNLFGINRTATVAGLLALVTVAFLVFAGLTGLMAESHLVTFAQIEGVASSTTASLTDVLAAAAIIFFAFAGYARVANLGHDVINPKRNIPRAIAIALAIVLALYVLLVFGLQNALGPKLASSDAVFIDLIEVSAPWLDPATVVLVASAAALGSLLSLLAGVSRTAATMAVDGELPKRLSVRNRHGAPWLAELMISFAAVVLTQLEDLIWVIGFSSFSVLIYYGIGHLSALRQPNNERLVPRWISWLGLVFCLGLVSSIPGPAISVSISILLIAIVSRLLVKRTVAKRQTGN